MLVHSLWFTLGISSDLLSISVQLTAHHILGLAIYLSFVTPKPFHFHYLFPGLSSYLSKDKDSVQFLVSDAQHTLLLIEGRLLDCCWHRHSQPSPVVWLQLMGGTGCTFRTDLSVSIFLESPVESLVDS